MFYIEKLNLVTGESTQWQPCGKFYDNIATAMTFGTVRETEYWMDISSSMHPFDHAETFNVCDARNGCPISHLSWLYDDHQIEF